MKTTRIAGLRAVIMATSSGPLPPGITTSVSTSAIDGVRSRSSSASVSVSMVSVPPLGMASLAFSARSRMRMPSWAASKRRLYLTSERARAVSITPQSSLRRAAAASAPAVVSRSCEGVMPARTAGVGAPCARDWTHE